MHEHIKPRILDKYERFNFKNIKKEHIYKSTTEITVRNLYR